jgi:hypothetical protein
MDKGLSFTLFPNALLTNGGPLSHFCTPPSKSILYLAANSPLQLGGLRIVQLYSATFLVFTPFSQFYCMFCR